MDMEAQCGILYAYLKQLTTELEDLKLINVEGFDAIRLMAHQVLMGEAAQDIEFFKAELASEGIDFPIEQLVA